MGLLDLPRKLMYNYLRIVGLMMLILYSLAQRAWASVKPSLSPITSIHDNIDPDKVQVVSIVQQFVKAVLMVAMLYWKVVTSVWEAVTRPFKDQVEAVYKFMDGIYTDYRETFDALNHKSE